MSTKNENIFAISHKFANSLENLVTSKDRTALSETDGEYFLRNLSTY